MVTAEIKLFTIDELSPEAFEKAYQYWLDTVSYPWGDENRESLDKFCEEFNVKVKNYQYGWGNSYIKWELTCPPEIKYLSGIRLYKYLMNHHYDYIFVKPRKFISKNGCVRQSQVLFVEISCPFTGYYMDDVLLSPIYEFLQKPDKRTRYIDLIARALDKWVLECDADVEYFYSKEHFKEYVSDDNWLFFEDGTPFKYWQYKHVKLEW